VREGAGLSRPHGVVTLFGRSTARCGTFVGGTRAVHVFGGVVTRSRTVFGGVGLVGGIEIGCNIRIGLCGRGVVAGGVGIVGDRVAARAQAILGGELSLSSSPGTWDWTPGVDPSVVLM
jgi:hypothetical protein